MREGKVNSDSGGEGELRFAAEDDEFKASDETDVLEGVNAEAEAFNFDGGEGHGLILQLLEIPKDDVDWGLGVEGIDT